MHSRFEHSLGVYHVAGEVMDYLKRTQVSGINYMVVGEEVVCLLENFTCCEGYFFLENFTL